MSRSLQSQEFVVLYRLGEVFVREQAARVIAEPGEVLILFCSGVGAPEVGAFLREYFAEESKRGRHLEVKDATRDYTGILISVPMGWENRYVLWLGQMNKNRIQFVQRHHRIHVIRTAGH